MIRLYEPKKEDLWFREQFMGEEETMSYNHAWGGTIPFPAEQWEQWYEYWIAENEGQRFYRYLFHEETKSFVGEAAYHYDGEFEAYMADVTVTAGHRGRGYGAEGLSLLCRQARRNGITELYDNIALDNSAVHMFLKHGFVEAYRTDEFIMLKKNLFDEKVLFLDIDGVLNSNVWNDSHPTEISDGMLIDEEKIKLLALLVRETDAEIILHSGWRFWFDSQLKPLCAKANNLVELLSKENLYISGITPDLTTEEIRKTRKFSLVKADEILLWLKLHHSVAAWVVLDDLDLHNDQIEQHQVKTDPTIGLTLKNVKQAVKILSDNF